MPRPCTKAGRAIAAPHFVVLESRDLGYLNAEERKVRTLKGSEPANGGASEKLGFRILDSGLRFSGDDKCNRKQTSPINLRSQI